jgi:TolA-binding protein
MSSEMMTPAEMMADAAKRSFADQQTIKAAQQEIKELKQEIKELKQENNALEQQNKDLNQRVETLEISQEGQPVVAPEGKVSEKPVTPSSVEGEGILGHELSQHKGPFSARDYVYSGKYSNPKLFNKAIESGDGSGDVDSCAICDGWIGDDDDYDPCNCDDDYYWVCSFCGVLLSKDRAEAEEQFRLHLEML